jgi:bifunctional DNA-binding transcriptional regulator/antitoxin component of YhaV-PrlF toxin-antitoxin module
MKIQIPTKVDNKHRVTIPAQIYRKLAPHDEVLVEYDMGQPYVVHIVIIKKENHNKET